MANLRSNLKDPLHVLSDRGKGVALVLIAGVFWSFAGLFVRLIEYADEWQILFFRSITLISFLLVYFLLFRRSRILKSFKDSGLVGIAAGFALGLAFSTWIHALTNTTVANALFLLSTAPFIAAVLGWWILGERVAYYTIWFILLAFLGVAVMVSESYQLGTLLGSIMAVLAATGFGVFAVLLRKGRNTDLLPSVFWAGVFAAIIATFVIVTTDSSFSIVSRDLFYCAMMGIFQVGIGLIIFTHGVKYLPAAEVTLLSLTEIILGPIWVWLVVGEVPGALTVIGGIVVMTAIAGQSFFTLRRSS